MAMKKLKPDALMFIGWNWPFLSPPKK